MIAFLRGKLAAEETGEVIIDVNGVGYRVLVSGSTLSQVPSIGEELMLHTQLVVREDSMQLFGFKNKEEQAIFLALLNVSGVGPKGCLAVLSTYPPQEISRFIATEDFAALTKVPGIGKKIAQRIVLELKDKLPQYDLEIISESKGSFAKSQVAEVEEALVALGYSFSEAHGAVLKVKNSEDGLDNTETLLKAALKYLMK